MSEKDMFSLMIEEKFIPDDERYFFSFTKMLNKTLELEIQHNGLVNKAFIQSQKDGFTSVAPEDLKSGMETFVEWSEEIMPLFVQDAPKPQINMPAFTLDLN